MEAASTLAPAAMPQHMQALAHANRVRLARASLKRDDRDRRRRCGGDRQGMPVGGRVDDGRELLRSQRRWGRTRARKFLFSIALNENRELGRLTEPPARAARAELEASDPRLTRRLTDRTGSTRSTGRAPGARPAAARRRRGSEADVERQRAGAGEDEEPDPEADHREPGARRRGSPRAPTSAAARSRRSSSSGVAAVEPAEHEDERRRSRPMIPTIVTIRAVPSEAEPCTCEPIHSQPSGTPTQRQQAAGEHQQDERRAGGTGHDLPDPGQHRAAEVTAPRTAGRSAELDQAPGAGAEGAREGERRQRRRRPRRPRAGRPAGAGRGDVEEQRQRGDAGRAGEQRGVRAVAAEVLADRELEPGERAEHEPGAEQDACCGRRRREAATSITSATRTTSSTSGNEPQGAGGRSSSIGLRRRARGLAGAAAASAAGAASARLGAAGRRGRGLRRFFAIRTRRVGGGRRGPKPRG